METYTYVIAEGLLRGIRVGMSMSASFNDEDEILERAKSLLCTTYHYYAHPYDEVTMNYLDLRA